MAAVYELEDSSSMKNHRLVREFSFHFCKNTFCQLEIYSID